MAIAQCRFQLVNILCAKVPLAHLRKTIAEFIIWIASGNTNEPLKNNCHSYRCDFCYFSDRILFLRVPFISYLVPSLRLGMPIRGSAS
ncbi:MAG: hypothetical protein ACYTXA_05655 [Nostoc sp.]